MNNYSILNNMYFQGTVPHTNVNSLKTKDYIIEIERQEVTKTFFDIQYVYRCILRFKDLLGRVVCELVFSEAQAQVLIDNISTFICDNYTTMYALNNITLSGTTSTESYSIFLKETENKDKDFCVLLQLICTNSVLQTTFPKFTATLELDELDNLCNIMFFVYLIDLVSERQGIYQV